MMLCGYFDNNNYFRVLLENVYNYFIMYTNYQTLIPIIIIIFQITLFDKTTYSYYQ